MSEPRSIEGRSARDEAVLSAVRSRGRATTKTRHEGWLAVLQKDHSDNKARQLSCPQTLLTKALAGVIRASAGQIHPRVFREIVRGIGMEQGRLAASAWQLAHDRVKRGERHACVECLKAIGQQCGWTIRVAAKSDDTLTLTILKCQFTESSESGLYLCELAAGLFAGAVAETLGYAKIYANQCSNTPPLDCAFMIYLRESKRHTTLPDSIPQQIEEASALTESRLADGGPGERLTLREQQIIRLIAQGFTDKQIAKTLQRSVRTIENHAARIRQKLRIENRTGLIRFAYRTHLIEP